MPDPVNVPKIAARERGATGTPGAKLAAFTTTALERGCMTQTWGEAGSEARFNTTVEGWYTTAPEAAAGKGAVTGMPPTAVR